MRRFTLSTGSFSRRLMWACTRPNKTEASCMFRDSSVRDSTPDEESSMRNRSRLLNLDVAALKVLFFCFCRFEGPRLYSLRLLRNVFLNRLFHIHVSLL